MDSSTSDDEADDEDKECKKDMEDEADEEDEEDEGELALELSSLREDGLTMLGLDMACSAEPKWMNDDIDFPHTQSEDIARRGFETLQQESLNPPNYAGLPSRLDLQALDDMDALQVAFQLTSRPGVSVCCVYSEALQPSELKVLFPDVNDRLPFELIEAWQHYPWWAKASFRNKDVQVKKQLGARLATAWERNPVPTWFIPVAGVGGVKCQSIFAGAVPCVFGLGEGISKTWAIGTELSSRADFALGARNPQAEECTIVQKLTTKQANLGVHDNEKFSVCAPLGAPFQQLEPTTQTRRIRKEYRQRVADYVDLRPLAHANSPVQVWSWSHASECACKLCSATLQTGFSVRTAAAQDWGIFGRFGYGYALNLLQGSNVTPTEELTPRQQRNVARGGRGGINLRVFVGVVVVRVG